MIIGNKNNNGFTSNFEKRHNFIVEEGKKNREKVNMFQEDKRVKIASSDATNKIVMADKSLAILQERYRNGLITIDEFNKKCEQINKMRNN